MAVIRPPRLCFCSGTSTGGRLKPALLVLAAVVILLLMPATITAINDYRMCDHEEPHNITTAAAVTSANVTLVQDLMDDNTVWVTLESDNALDAPIPYSYSSNVLLITGLAADDTRAMTITYKIDNLSDYLAAGIASKILPVLLILGILGLIGGAVYQATRGRD